MAEPSPQLVQRARAGDSAAWRQLIEEQQAYVYSIALGIVRQPEDAADLTQEAFARLYQTIGSYRGETRFTTWLYRLVVNLGLDLLRRRGRAREVSLEDDPLEVPDDDPLIDPPLILERRERAEQIRAALDQLPTAQRLALTLYYFEDRRYEEIATILGLPLNTVKSHIRRAKLALARRLGVPRVEEIP
ncbi:MAG: sigma-70 family RNA polymerase sigma factor [Chloroflexi bacterium]|nr:sigma-70 family RNA polymerase sigma factor [Chloroflexota bacterium]